MKKILFVNLVFAFSFALFSCGPSQAELLAQTSVAETAIVASWTDTPLRHPH
jgi:hypothetical protein